MTRLKPKAFTLVEVLAATIILAGIIVTLILHDADGLLTSLKIERRARSTLLAGREMEKIKNTLRKSFGTDFAAWPSSLGDNYLADRTATDLSSTLKVVEVSVGYDADSNGTLGTDEIMVMLTTQIAERS